MASAKQTESETLLEFLNRASKERPEEFSSTMAFVHAQFLLQNNLEIAIAHVYGFAFHGRVDEALAALGRLHEWLKGHMRAGNWPAYGSLSEALLFEAVLHQERRNEFSQHNLVVVAPPTTRPEPH